MRQEDTRCRQPARAKTSPLERKTHKNSSLLIESSNDEFQDLRPLTKASPRPSQPFSLMSFLSSNFNSNNFDPSSFFCNFNPNSFFCNFNPSSFFCHFDPTISSATSTQQFLLQLRPQQLSNASTCPTIF